MVYRLEFWVINRNIKQKMDVAKMRMLSLLSEVTIKMSIYMNSEVDSIGVASILDKMNKNNLHFVQFSWVVHLFFFYKTRKLLTRNITLLIALIV